MKVTKQARQEAKQLFRACLVDGLLDENRVRQAVSQLLTRKPRGYLAIVSHLEHLVKLDVARRTARIESATPLPDPLQADLREKLTRSYGRGLSFSFVQNPALLGGLRIKVGSDVYDGTVQGRLRALEEKFESSI